MIRTKIKIRFQNGLTFKYGVKEILAYVADRFEFIESDDPDFIIFGPYGNDIPAKSERYIRVGYFCENIKPDMSICEWAFGIPREEEINNTRYKRIQWHGVDPQQLVKAPNYKAEEIAAGKKKFCNFLYSNHVPYREEFFRQLSKYKKVDAPGQSMNNMSSIDELYKGDKWERKKQFLSEYKFTIAFENYVYPGYQTEKLFDAMQVNSLPVYCGDPLVCEIFNTHSFINAPDYIPTSNSATVNFLEKYAQQDFKDLLPSFYNKPVHRVKRKLKSMGRQLKLNYQFQKMNFEPLIARLIELDQDQDKYVEVLKQPWFVNNTPPLNASLENRWVEIFSGTES